MRKLIAILLLATAAGATVDSTKSPRAAELGRMAARLAPTDLKVDLAGLSAGDRKAMANLIRASRIVNDIFLDQMWKGNRALHAKLQGDSSPLGRARLRYFWLNKSPWSEIDGYTAFLPGVPEKKPLGANFYPEDMTKEEFASWFQTLSPGEKEQASGFYTVIRRGPGGKLRIAPYSEAYRPDLERAAKLLRSAAAATGNATLKKFLELRAASFLSNDYFESDLAWMDLDAPIDATIGPYETYNDSL